VARNLGDAGAVLAVDETGFLKKGTQSAGVARQYTGTAGRVENSQAGVFLADAAPDGSRALIDRELYLPEKWAGERERCRAAGIGDDVAFAAKPQLAKSMIGRAVKAGVPFSWVTGDEAYGGNPGLREWLGKEKIPYVLGIACNAMIATAVGGRPGPLPGPQVPRLVPPRHLVYARPRVPGRHRPRRPALPVPAGTCPCLRERSQRAGQKGDLTLAGKSSPRPGHTPLQPS
jgi:SRSO17 transposase